MQFLDSFMPLIAQYDAFILDLWGVIHDGSALYPGVQDTLRALHESGAGVVLLSNAPRRAAKAQTVLDQLGVKRAWYGHLLTSGEAGYAWMQTHLPAHASYVFIGPERDADVVSGLGYREVSDAREASFILCAGFTDDHEPLDSYETILQKGAQRGLPFLCLNPDRVVVKQNGERLPCAGLIAERYEQLGGSVHYVGKPYPDVYHHCFSLLGGVMDKSRILAVGDGLHTDILGARGQGIASAYVAGGILKGTLGIEDFSAATQSRIRDYCTQEGITPDYVVPAFR